MRCYPEIHCDMIDKTVAVAEDCMGRGGLDGKGNYEGKKTPDGPCTHFCGYDLDMDGLPAFGCFYEAG